MVASLAIIGGIFINKVKNLRSDTWKKQKIHTIILIAAIEFTILADHIKPFENIIPERYLTGDFDRIRSHLTYMINYCT